MNAPPTLGTDSPQLICRLKDWLGGRTSPLAYPVFGEIGMCGLYHTQAQGKRQLDLRHPRPKRATL